MTTHQSDTNQVEHILFNVCSNHTMFKLHGTKIQNMQFAVYISDTTVTLKQVKVNKPRIIMQTLSKVIIIQRLKDLALIVSEKKAILKFF